MEVARQVISHALSLFINASKFHAYFLLFAYFVLSFINCQPQVEDGYNELLKVLKNNPPYIESHVKALEIEVGHCLPFHYCSLFCLKWRVNSLK